MGKLLQPTSHSVESLCAMNHAVMFCFFHLSREDSTSQPGFSATRTVICTWRLCFCCSCHCFHFGHGMRCKARAFALFPARSASETLPTAHLLHHEMSAG